MRYRSSEHSTASDERGSGPLDGPLASWLVERLSSTSTRTFVLWPAVIGAEQLVSRRPVRWRVVPLAVAGYALYRLAGTYRNRSGGGGPGLSNPPERLVTSGVYGLSRNPMYFGHLVCLAGMAAATRSPLAAALFVWHVPWFDRRAARDEAHLVEIFGDEYRAYRDRVPRWLGLPGR